MYFWEGWGGMGVQLSWSFIFVHSTKETKQRLYNLAWIQTHDIKAFMYVCDS
jgi:hypothetical protein